MALRTLTQLRTLMTDFMSMDLDNYRGESPSSSEQNVQLNWAYQLIAKRCKLFDPAITLTLTASTATYNIRDITTPIVSKKVLRPYRVIINNVALTGRDGYQGLWSFTEFENDVQGWRSASAATPYIAVWQNYNILRLHPKPTASNVSTGNNYIAGTYLPVDMSSDGDYPDLPEEIHEAIAYIAAAKAASPMATEAEMWKRLETFMGEAESVIRDVESQQSNMLAAWGTTGVQVGSDFMAM